MAFFYEFIDIQPTLFYLVVLKFGLRALCLLCWCSTMPQPLFAFICFQTYLMLFAQGWPWIIVRLLLPPG
jgi:hypothetical protein